MPATAPSHAAEDENRSPGAFRVVHRCCRLLTIVLLIATVWWAAANWIDLLRPVASALPQEESAPTSLADMPPLAQSFLAPGQWSLGSTAWEVSIRDVTTADLAQRAGTWPETIPRELPSLAAEEQRMLTMIQSVPAVETSRGDVRQLRWEADGFLATAFIAPVQGEGRLIEVWAALLDGNAAGKLISASPSAGGAVHGVALLPYGEEAQVVAARHNAQGERNCEIVRAPAPVGSLVEVWKRDGWTVANDSRAGSALAWTCRKGAVYLSIVVVRQEGRQAVLVVTRPSG